MTSTTDERLDAALRRAAEPVMRTSLKAAYDLRAGWAEAIRHLTTIEDAEDFDDDDYIPHLGDCYVGKCEICKAVTKFIRAMLGGDDEQH